jgi:hypothetical protein
VAGRAAATRREYVQIFKGFHRFLQARKAAEIQAVFGVRLVCPVDEFNASRHVGDDSPALLLVELNRALRTLGEDYRALVADVHARFLGHGLATGNPGQAAARPGPVVLPADRA